MGNRDIGKVGITLLVIPYKSNMPYVPKHPCSKPGCPNLVDRGVRFCPEHAKAQATLYDKHRGSAAERGYDAIWQKVRRRKLRRNPVCEECNREPATTVHHIIPISENPRLRLRADNLMALCRDCHERIERDRGKRYGGVTI